MEKKIKAKAIYQENYKAGTVIDKIELKRLIDENIDGIQMEMKQRIKYSDGTEEIVVKIRF
jgi:hypothetical protein